MNTPFTLFNIFGTAYRKIVFTLTDITHNAKRLLIHIAFREYKNGYMSELQENIAKKLGLTARTVRNLTRGLIEKGYIRTEVPTLPGRRHHREKIIYKILPDRFRLLMEFNVWYNQLAESGRPSVYFSTCLKKRQFQT